MKTADVLVIGSGIAGITAAQRQARDPRRSIILLNSASDAHESNTFYAQGGIVTRGAADSLELLVQDILEAGAGASLPEAARILAEEGPALVDELLIHGAAVQFDREKDGSLAFGQEAAHSRSGRDRSARWRTSSGSTGSIFRAS